MSRRCLVRVFLFVVNDNDFVILCLFSSLTILHFFIVVSFGTEFIRNLLFAKGNLCPLDEIPLDPALGTFVLFEKPTEISA